MTYIVRENRLYSSNHITQEERIGYEKEALARKNAYEKKKEHERENQMVQEKTHLKAWKICSCYDNRTLTEKDKIYNDNNPF